jgi:hypothetical protein
MMSLMFHITRHGCATLLPQFHQYHSYSLTLRSRLLKKVCCHRSASQDGKIGLCQTLRNGRIPLVDSFLRNLFRGEPLILCSSRYQYRHPRCIARFGPTGVTCPSYGPGPYAFHRERSGTCPRRPSWREEAGILGQAEIGKRCD